MKITTAQLRQIIKEEVAKALNENVDVQSKVEEFKENPRRWQMALDSVVDMAFGGDGDGGRDYYPGWQDQDFKDLLTAMGEDLGDYGLDESVNEGIVDKAKEYAEVIKRELIDNGVAVSVAGTLALSIATMLQAGGADVNPAKAVALLGAVGTAVQAGMKVANISDKSGGDMYSQVKPD